ncbi:hypothetical protein SLS64_001230 [Diaporthe eres]
MQMSSEAQSPTHQLRPILIHIHDFNALFMDESDVLKQILLWTGSLRSDGCKVSVIGTGSISRASQQHWHFLDLDFASTEGFRVISLPSSLPGIDSTALEERESLLCNAEMIAKLIVALHEPQDVDGRPLYGILAAERIRGCLLYGPPGTGKTLLAKAVAKETGANVLEVTAASIQHSQVGVSEKTVRSLFSLAKRADLSPLIIFVDEADSLLGSRDGGGADSSGGWRRSVMNQFLREMDGLEASSACVMLATNRPFDLDDAVLRRLPRKLLVDMPLEADRAAILRIHLAGEELDPAVSVDDIARRTPLYSGSDLKNVCVAAAMACVYEGFGGERGSAGQTTEVSSRRRRRVLSAAHFEVALSEISASVSVDMASLRAIKRFDDKYGGDAGAKRQRKAGVGFGGNVEVTDADVPRVRM